MSHLCTELLRMYLAPLQRLLLDTYNKTEFKQAAVLWVIEAGLVNPGFQNKSSNSHTFIVKGRQDVLLPTSCLVLRL